MKKEYFLTDMSKCEPEDSISEYFEKNCWQKTDYELENNIKGTMLYADPADNAGVLTLHLDIQGVYKIYIGINYPRQPYHDGHYGEYNGCDYGALFVKLSKDRGYTRIGIEKYDKKAQKRYEIKVLVDDSPRDHFNTIYETYWKTADLTDQHFILSPPKAPYDNQFFGQVANISFIRLVKAAEDHMRFEEKLISSEKTKNLTAFWCSGAISGHTSGHPMYHPKERVWFETEIEPYRNSDFEILCVEAIRGELCCFKTNNGYIGTPDNKWPEEWFDPLKEFTELGHDTGMKVFASIRMIGGSQPYNKHPVNRANFFWENPQWAKRDKEGNICGSCSIAFEQVRAHWLLLIEDALLCGVDGIQLHLNRCEPFVLYEEPVISDYINTYGDDPRSLPEDDRWERHCAQYMTVFLREIRALVFGKYKKQVSIIVRGFKKIIKGSVGRGVDMENIVKEGLVDYLYLDHSTDPEYISYLKALSLNEIKICCNLMPRTQPGEAYVDLADFLYNKGSDGFVLWDCERRVQRLSEWAVIKKLGHRDELLEIRKESENYFKTHRIVKHRGLNVAYSYRDG